MTYVLNNYIIKGKNTYEPIIKGNITESFERYVVDKINQYKGYIVEDLCEKFEIKYGKNPKILFVMFDRMGETQKIPTNCRMETGFLSSASGCTGNIFLVN